MKRYLIRYKTNDNLMIQEAENLIHDNEHNEYIFENLKSGTPLLILSDLFIEKIEEIEVKEEIK